MSHELRFHGCMPANLLPFTADLDIDEPAYRKHLRWLADTPGVTGIVANGHAAEVSSLTREERKRTLAIALDEMAGKVPVVAGVYSDGTLEAVELARDARAAGAAGLLVFPPTLFMWGAQLKPDMVLRHFQTLADAVDLPLVVFEYPLASGIGYSPETLAELCKIPTVAAVKDWSNEIVSYEKNLRALRASGRPGGDAVFVHHVADGELPARRRRVHLGDGQRDRRPPGRPCSPRCRRAISTRRAAINERLAPLVTVFYAPPFVDMHNRMKEALAHPRPDPGRARAAARSPPISEDERHRIRLALRASGLSS